MNEEYLKEAIAIASKNVEQGGGPFGALIVKDGAVLASSGNLVTISNDPTAHAEILVIREACAKLETWDLLGCELYSSCEPCPMCMGAIYWAHIDKIYYAASHDDAREAGFDDSDIYREIRKAPEDRKIVMQQKYKEEGWIPFKTWQNKEDKNEY